MTFEDGSILEFCAAVGQQAERSQIEIAGEHGAVQAFPWAVYSVDPATNERLARFVAEGCRPAGGLAPEEAGGRRVRNPARTRCRRPGA